MTTKTFKINYEGVSHKSFWQTIKNCDLLIRFKGGRKIATLYNMPYGGFEKSNNYNLYEISYNQ